MERSGIRERSDRRGARARRLVLLAAVSLLAAVGVAQPALASTSVTIIVSCLPGSQQRCPVEPLAIPSDGGLRYEPDGAEIPRIVGETFLTSGWIGLPASAGLLMSAVGDDEIRAITLPSGLLESPVAVVADATALGLFGPAERIDFEALLGSAAKEVGVHGIELLGERLPLRVDMRSFDPDGNPFDPWGRSGRVRVVLTPEPTSGVLLAFGLVLAGARRGRRARRLR